MIDLRASGNIVLQRSGDFEQHNRGGSLMY